MSKPKVTRNETADELRSALAKPAHTVFRVTNGNATLNVARGNSTTTIPDLQFDGPDGAYHVSSERLRDALDLFPSDASVWFAEYQGDLTVIAQATRKGAAVQWRILLSSAPPVAVAAE